MNKKNLSVVMAGAMLATSVAPVLADATTSEMSVSQAELLVYGLKNKIKSESLSTNSALYTKLTLNSSAAPTGADASLYKIEVNGVDKTSDIYSGTYTSANVNEGDVIKVYEKTYNTFLGNKIAGTLPQKTADAATYTSEDLKNIEKIVNGTMTTTGSDSTLIAKYPGLVDLGDDNNFGGDSSNADTLSKYIKAKSATLNETGDTLTIKLNSLKSLTNTSSNNTLEIKVGSSALDFNIALDANGNADEAIQNCVGFMVNDTYTSSTDISTKTLVETITVTAATETDDKKASYLASDLYDGFALTAAGTEIADMIGNEKYVTTYKAYNTDDNAVGEIDGTSTTVSKITTDPATGICTMEIGITSKGAEVKTITVYSTNAEEIKALYNMLKDGSYEVGIIGGATRYETAVNVAKAQKIALGTTATSSSSKNIVLVNGTSLVDGLAAAPLAATINGNVGTNMQAPVLLTESDKLSTATKEYLNDLLSEADLKPSEIEQITVNLVGGKGVLSDSLVKELEGMGFTVVRYGGDNREETSLKVAEKVASKADGENEVFVVGGNGEADAMSIAGYAAQEGKAIIVSSVHGLTDDAVDFIKKNASAASDAGVTIIGGETVVSKDEEAKVDEVIETAVDRVAGANRQETNAKVIDEFYTTDATGVVLVKDGINDSSELVDALSAANYAATMKAPIVLASSKVTDKQKTALLGMGANGVTKVSQVGIGAERTILETIADLFGVSNTK